jgi:uncharacterized membrane protein
VYEIPPFCDKLLENNLLPITIKEETQRITHKINIFSHYFLPSPDLISEFNIYLCFFFHHCAVPS